MSAHYAIRPHRFGPVLVVWTDAGVVRVALGSVEPPDGAREGDDPLVDRVLDALTTGDPAGIPFVLEGTPFQERVWTALRAVPPGETRTYAELAASLDPPSVARAVGTACGANALAGLVPCHRVIRGDGGLGGYRWGLERKRAMLAAEARGSLL